MSCTTWNDRLIEKLYGEISPENDRELAAHLDSCEPCRTTLAEFERVGTILHEDEPAVPRTPRVLVLRPKPAFRPALLAASLVATALLAGAGWGAGYALGRRGTTGRVDPQAATASTASTPASADTEQLVQREVDRRLAAWERSREAQMKNAPAVQTGSASDKPVTSTALRAELAGLERRFNGARAADLDYVLDQIAASEGRVGDRIGKTNHALKTVALASNSRVNDQ